MRDSIALHDIIGTIFTSPYTCILDLFLEALSLFRDANIIIFSLKKNDNDLMRHLLNLT